MEKKQYSLFDLLDRELVKKAQDNMNQNGAGKKILYDVNDFDIVDLDKRNYVAIWVEGRIVGYIVEDGESDDSTVSKAVLENSAKILECVCENNLKMKRLNEELQRTSELKSNFLANMSHEIRTPMNAVIGLAEMALREDLSPVTEGYIRQIKSSGQSLLTIINDILDFSKIESGKLDIIYSEYDVMQMVSDVGYMIMNRIGKKNIELIIDVNPKLPKVLVGDCVRIKQILINLATNAVKFTDSGKVTIWIDFFKKSDFEITLLGSVEDTGIGIREEDIGKLFDSFTQLESRKNRSVEGTGLGLAITKNLVSLMNGTILVESKYGEGSKFAFQIPQRIATSSPCVEINTETISKVGILVDNMYIREALKRDLTRLMVEFYDFDAKGKMDYDYVFLEKELYSDEIKDLAKDNPQTIFVIITGYYDAIDSDLENVVLARKPVYVNKISAILKHEDPNAVNYAPDSNYIDFCAPDAKILLVDDNEINLTVVEGLLEPLKMQIDTATHGRQALEMIKQKKYDLIFMDHMMPEMDGVDVTRIIRKDYPEYNNVPIIALTANAMEESKTMFLVEGMNDFISKPVELRLLVACIKRWLPKEMQKHFVEDKKEKSQHTVGYPVIGDLNVIEAVRLLGSEKMFWKVAEDYCKDIDHRSKIIRGYLEQKNWDMYTIEVHSLKSTSKQIGAMRLSEMAAELEKAGKNNDIQKIMDTTDALLEVYESYKEILQPYFHKEEISQHNGALLEGDMREECLGKLQIAAANLDFDAIEQIIGEMDNYSYSDEDKEKYEALKIAFDNVDFAAINTLLKDWE